MKGQYGITNILLGIMIGIVIGVLVLTWGSPSEKEITTVSTIPNVYMSYFDENQTNCSIKMPFWFVEMDAPIYYSNTFNESFVHNKWYINFNPNEWNCTKRDEYGTTEHEYWCDCEFSRI